MKSFTKGFAAGATALATVMLAFSFVILLVINGLQRRRKKP